MLASIPLQTFSPDLRKVHPARAKSWTYNKRLVYRENKIEKIENKRVKLKQRVQ